MKLEKLSASSLQVAQGCLARWKAEYLDKGRGASGKAANTGTAVHGALEKFVEAVYIEKTIDWADMTTLNLMYQIAYVEAFNNSASDSPEYKDGWNLVAKWHQRTDLSRVAKIVSVEEYRTQMIKTSIGEIPLNYIMDRFDILEFNEDGTPKVVRVVDYKTIRVPITSEELLQKIQAKVYAVMARIMFPNVERIWVVFDMLRHEPVGVAFSREDNIAAWHEIKGEAERIIAADENNLPETLNADCRYCSRAASCHTLQRLIQVGNVQALTLEEAAALAEKVDYQLKGLEALAESLQETLLREALHQDALSYTAGNKTVTVTAGKRRKIVDSSRIAQIIGPELTAQIGSFTLGNLDNLIKGGSLSDEQVKQVEELITQDYNTPKAKVKDTK